MPGDLPVTGKASLVNHIAPKCAHRNEENYGASNRNRGKKNEAPNIKSNNRRFLPGGCVRDAGQGRHSATRKRSTRYVELRRREGFGWFSTARFKIDWFGDSESRPVDHN